MSTTAVGAVGAAHNFGVFPGVADPRVFMPAPATWTTHAVTLALYSVGITVVVHAVQHRLVEVLKDLGVRSGALSVSERKYRLLAESITDVVFVHKLDLSIDYVSPSVATVSGYTVQEVVKLTMQDLMMPESYARASAELQQCLIKAMSEGIDTPPLLC
jgi:PAS domain-containing protein